MLNKKNRKQIGKSTFYTLFKGYVLRRGKSQTTNRIINKSLLHVYLKTRNPSSIIFKKYIKEIGTIFDVRDISFRGKIVRVPFALNKDKRNKQIFRSLLAVVRNQKVIDTMNSKISTEFINAILGRETAIHTYNVDNAREIYSKRYIWSRNWKI